MIKYSIVFCAESLKQLQGHRPDSGQQGNEERQTDRHIKKKKLGLGSLSSWVEKPQYQKLNVYNIEFNREVGLLHTAE